LHDPVTWYKIKYTGEQVAQWDFQNNAIRSSPPGPVFVLEVPLRNLITSICNFVPCDRIVQRAYSRIRLPFYIFFLNPVYAAACSLRSLRNNKTRGHLQRLKPLVPSEKVMNFASLAFSLDSATKER